MKHRVPVVAIAGLVLAFGCTKQSTNVGAPQSTTSNANVRFNGHTASRAAGLNGQGYSQSMPLDSANRMILSYLTSQNYPAVDNSLRSLSFSADALRGYLANDKIATLKFLWAHTPGYISAGNFGKDAGMSPLALTFVVAGLDESNSYVVNTNGVLAAGNSLPINVDQANQMIQSYLTSQNYPSVDVSLRSLSFDADTLRSYLLNPAITTITLQLAHQPGYMNSNYGVNAGMNPAALTVVVKGVNQSNQTVLTSTGGLYEHFNPCPSYCGSSVDAYIHN